MKLILEKGMSPLKDPRDRMIELKKKMAQEAPKYTERQEEFLSDVLWQFETTGRVTVRQVNTAWQIHLGALKRSTRWDKLPKKGTRQ